MVRESFWWPSFRLPCFFFGAITGNKPLFRGNGFSVPVGFEYGDAFTSEEAGRESRRSWKGRISRPEGGEYEMRSLTISGSTLGLTHGDASKVEQPMSDKYMSDICRSQNLND